MSLKVQYIQSCYQFFADAKFNYLMVSTLGNPAGKGFSFTFPDRLNFFYVFNIWETRTGSAGPLSWWQERPNLPGRQDQVPEWQGDLSGGVSTTRKQTLTLVYECLSLRYHRLRGSIVKISSLSNVTLLFICDFHISRHDGQHLLCGWCHISLLPMSYIYIITLILRRTCLRKQDR